MLLALPIAFGFWLWLPVSALTARVPAPERPAALPGLPWLSTRGTRIVDGSGRAVMLHGFNDEALLPATATVHPVALDRRDAELIETSGFNVVRLPIAWSLLEPERGVFSSAYLDSIAAAVDLLTAHRLYVVLDMHFLAWSPVYGGAGAPAWATLGWIPDWTFGQHGNTPLRLLSPAINGDEAYFFLTSDWQDQMLRAWQVVASRFRDDSGLAGYDVFNEAHSFPVPPLLFDKDQLFPFYAHAISAIASVDPNHLYILENDASDDIPTAVVPIHAPNVLYSPHVYTDVLSPGLGSVAQALGTHVDEVAREAAQLGTPMWVGEFGDGTVPGATAWISLALKDFGAHDAGWCWWVWRAADTNWSIRSANGRSLNRTFLRLLAQPYLAAAPPGVSDSGGDGVTGRLQVDVAADHGSRGIEVAWGAFILGAPAVSSSCAAGSSWDAATARLTLSVPAGVACRITLTRRR
jgi:endoglycosylceramidase